MSSLFTLNTRLDLLWPLPGREPSTYVEPRSIPTVERDNTVDA